MADIKFGKDLGADYDTFLDQTTGRLDRATAPIWDAELNVSKTIITLASGALVLSGSFVQKSAGAGGSNARFYLVIALISFVVSICAGVLSLNSFGPMRSFNFYLELQRRQARTLIEAVEPGPSAIAVINKVASNASDEASKIARSATATYRVLRVVMLASFMIAMISFTAMAIVSLQ